MDIADYVNDLPPSSRLGSLDDFLREEALASPVDMYQRSITQILRYGTRERLLESDFLGRLLVIGIVSATEAYFRAILSSCIEICPVAQSIASEKTINLGGLLWHGRAGFSRSAFEHATFTSKDELTRACKQYLGIELDKRIFGELLDQFEIVCQLRHGIVHGDGLLPGRNAVQLDIKRYKKPVRITVGYGRLQAVAAVVSTLVMTLNRQIFLDMCKRWAVDWRRRADWEPQSEKRSFGVIWNIFYCKEEAMRKRGRTTITKSDCLSAIRALYNI
jgi:hypothetical protein